MRNLFIKFILIFFIFSCGGGDDNGNDPVIPQTPAIIVDKTSISFDETMVSKSSSASSILIESKNVDSGLNISSSDGFEISFNNLDFSNSLTIEANQSKTVYVRFSPSKIQTYNGNINIQNTQATDVKINLSGEGIQLKYNYKTFSKKRLAWGSGYSRAASQNFDLHNDNSNIESIKMYIRLECPSVGCDGWDRYANILIKNSDTNQWFEMARHITPYGVGNSQLDRGLEVDVTDFKSMLTGNVELKIFADTWVDTGWSISVEFDFLDGTPDYKYYQISPVIQFNNNSLGGVPYGGKISPDRAKNDEPDVITSQKDIEAKFDLKKSISVGPNIKSMHFRTIISGWGHATPTDSDGRGCAEWCFRTHKIKIDNNEKFSHYMGPIGCSSNPINNQSGNWIPDRAGWCPGMIVPVRLDKFDSDMSNSTINFEYYFQPWVNNFQYTGNNRNAYNAISTFIVLKSDQQIDAATISD
jgi:hypothetical protein